jgi:flagellar basal-body rod modification protein FlgD
MTTTAATSAFSASETTAQISGGQTRLAQNFETFLALLTAQLKNQDPLSPVDSTQFTQQLVSMSGVEQQLLTNSLLKELVGSGTGALGRGVDYIGKDLTAIWDTTRLKDGRADWTYELDSAAGSVRLSVFDERGSLVWSGEGAGRSQGENAFSWNGADLFGNPRESGVYKLKVEATGFGGEKIASQTMIKGRATAAEVYDGKAYLHVGSSFLPLDSVISVSGATHGG